MHIITRLIIGGAQENTLLSVIGQQSKPGATLQLVSGFSLGAEGSLLADARAAGVDLVEIPTLIRAVSPRQDWLAYRHLRRQIREFKPDVVHTHSSKAGILGRLAAWHEGTPFIVHTIHGLPYHPYQSALKNSVFIAAEKFAVKRCHRVVSVAAAMTEQALRAGVGDASKYQTIYSGMRIEPFLESEKLAADSRRRFGFAETDLVIGKIARLFELKGHEYLFAAFAALAKTHPRARLFIVGDGLLRGEFTRQVAQLGIADRVVFSGLLPPAEIPAAIAAMDIVAHCSLREGLARVLPQALLSGKPTISFDVDGAREVVIDGKTGRLIPPQEVAALTAALRATSENMTVAREWALCGRQLCRERFDWRYMADQLYALYEAGLNLGATIE